MTGKEAYLIWAQAAGCWAGWTRPVPFISPAPKPAGGAALIIPKAACIKQPASDCAVILDLSGCEAVAEALALARLDMRPVPLYNGCNAQTGTMALVENSDIEYALLNGAAELVNISFQDDAPPVFMLDSNRTHRYKMNVSVFDNSWDIYPQDMPSPKYFLGRRIRNILVHGQKLNKDLKVLLYSYQRAGIKIYFTNGYHEAKRVSIRKPRKTSMLLPF